MGGVTLVYHPGRTWEKWEGGSLIGWEWGGDHRVVRGFFGVMALMECGYGYGYGYGWLWIWSLVMGHGNGYTTHVCMRADEWMDGWHAIQYSTRQDLELEMHK